MGFLIGIVVALGTLFWAVTRLMDGANDAGYAVRRFKWLRKSKQPVHDAVTDPREAATVLMCQMLGYDGPFGESERAVVRSALLEDIVADPAQADELVSVAEKILKAIGDATNQLKRFAKPLNENCTPEQKADLYRQLESLAVSGGPASDVQKHFLMQIERLLNLK